MREGCWKWDCCPRKDGEVVMTSGETELNEMMVTGGRMNRSVKKWERSGNGVKKGWDAPESSLSAWNAEIV